MMPLPSAVRDAGSVFYGRNFAAAATRSAPLGAVWQAEQELAFDVGLRKTRIGDRTAAEIRLGMTFAFAVPR